MVCPADWRGGAKQNCSMLKARA